MTKRQTLQLNRLPPTTNVLWRKGKGRTYLNPDVLSFNKLVKQVVNGNMHQYNKNDRLSVEITLRADSKRKYDIDNRIKATLDALQKADVYPDDAQIDKLVVTRLPPDKTKTAMTLIAIDTLP